MNCDMSPQFIKALSGRAEKLLEVTVALKKKKYYCSVMSDSETPWIVARQAPLCTEFSRQKYWCGFPCPPPWVLPNTG